MHLLECLTNLMFDNLIFLNDNSSNVPISALAKLSCIPVHSDLFEKESKQVVLVKSSCVLQYNCDIERSFIPAQNSWRDVKSIQHQVDLHHLRFILEKIFISFQGLRLDTEKKKKVLQKL